MIIKLLINENTLPILSGGGIGIYKGINAEIVSQFPTIEIIFTTIALGVLGGVSGYLGKLLFIDGTIWLWNKIFKKVNKIEYR